MLGESSRNGKADLIVRVGLEITVNAAIHRLARANEFVEISVEWK